MSVTAGQDWQQMYWAAVAALSEGGCPLCLAPLGEYGECRQHGYFHLCHRADGPWVVCLHLPPAGAVKSVNPCPQCGKDVMGWVVASLGWGDQWRVMARWRW